MTLIPVHIEPITCLQHEFSDYRVSLLRMHRRNHLNIIYDGKIKPAVMKLTRHKGHLSNKNPSGILFAAAGHVQTFVMHDCKLSELHHSSSPYILPSFFMQLYAFNFLQVN